MRPPRSFVPTSLALVLVAFGACADETVIVDDEADGPVAMQAELDNKADSATGSELRARVGQITLWLDVRAIADHASPSGQRVVISGRASRNLASVFSWVPDDAFGEAALVSARKFEITLDEAHEINSVLSGAPLYLSLTSTTGTPREYYARIAVEPRLWKFTGSRDIWLRDAILPVYVRDGRDNLRYRALATTTSAPTSFFAYTDDDSDPEVRVVDATTFELDWTYAGLSLAMTPSTDPVQFSASWGEPPAQRAVRKTALIAPTVVKLAMSTEDPYLSLVLDRTCDLAVRDCIALHAGNDDLGACGTYREVATCLAAGPICGEDSPDLELFPVASHELTDNVAAFNEAAPGGGSWSSVSDVALFRLPECLEANPDGEGLAHMLMNLQEYGGAWAGAALTRDEVLAQSPFSMAPDAARQLLGAFDGFVGGTNAQHWYATSEASCHNCHAWQTFIVIYYPEVGRVFALLGEYGWDS